MGRETVQEEAVIGPGEGNRRTGRPAPAYLVLDCWMLAMTRCTSFA